MVGAVVAQRLLQRLGDVLLPDDVGERLGAVAAVQRLRHAATLARAADTASGRHPCRTGSTGTKGPPAHPPEPAYPCCLPALGEFSGLTPHEGSLRSLSAPPPRRDSTTFSMRADGSPCLQALRRVRSPAERGRFRGRRSGGGPVSSPAEDSPSGLWRTLGKRVGVTPSRVRIPRPPLADLGQDNGESRMPGFGAIT